MAYVDLHFIMTKFETQVEACIARAHEVFTFHYD